MALVNRERVELVAQLIAALPDDFRPLNFYSFSTPNGEVVAEDMYPPLEHPAAADFFMFVCLHQYGFWLSTEHGYREPLIGRLNGKPCKGSDLLWKSVWRYLSRNETGLQPRNLMDISEVQLWEELFVDDNGPIEFADRSLRRLITREYGRQLQAEGLTSSKIIEAANTARFPLDTFISTMKEVEGFNGDQFNKKIMLLAMALHNRPEQLLCVTDLHNWQPIVDYHLIRLALRTGMVEITEDVAYLIRKRYFVRPAVEHEIRKATYHAFRQVIDQSGRSMFLVDNAAWQARRYCPEMTEPDCAQCDFESACAKRVELFQPIYRTINY